MSQASGPAASENRSTAAAACLPCFESRASEPTPRTMSSAPPARRPVPPAGGGAPPPRRRGRPPGPPPPPPPGPPAGRPPGPRPAASALGGPGERLVLLGRRRSRHRTVAVAVPVRGTLGQRLG